MQAIALPAVRRHRGWLFVRVRPVYLVWQHAVCQQQLGQVVQSKRRRQRRTRALERDPVFSTGACPQRSTGWLDALKDVLSVIAYVRKAAITSLDRPSVVLPGQLVPNTEQLDAPGGRTADLLAMALLIRDLKTVCRR